MFLNTVTVDNNLELSTTVAKVVILTTLESNSRVQIPHFLAEFKVEMDIS
jgi:hypothetical protein